MEWLVQMRDWILVVSVFQSFAEIGEIEGGREVEGVCQHRITDSVKADIQQSRTFDNIKWAKYKQWCGMMGARTICRHSLSFWLFIFYFYGNKQWKKVGSRVWLIWGLEARLWCNINNCQITECSGVVCSKTVVTNRFTVVGGIFGYLDQ